MREPAGQTDHRPQAEPRTQAARRASARRRLLEATIRLLAERGYTGTTLAEIGREAGLSRGLVTHHFGSKDACIAAAIEQIRVGAHRTFSRYAVELRGLARIDHLIQAYLGAAGDEQQYTRALYVVMADAISEAPSLRDAVAHTNELFRAQLRDWLHEAVEDGQIPATTDLDATAVLIEGLLRGVCLQWYADPERIDLAGATRAAQHLIRAGLSSPPPPASRVRTATAGTPRG